MGKATTPRLPPGTARHDTQNDNHAPGRASRPREPPRGVPRLAGRRPSTKPKTRTGRQQGQGLGRLVGRGRLPHPKGDAPGFEQGRSAGHLAPKAPRGSGGLGLRGQPGAVGLDRGQGAGRRPGPVGADHPAQVRRPLPRQFLSGIGLSGKPRRPSRGQQSDQRTRHSLSRTPPVPYNFGTTRRPDSAGEGRGSSPTEPSGSGENPSPAGVTGGVP